MTPADQFERALENRNHAEPVEIWRARNVIHQDSTDVLSLTKVAKAVNISANHLSEKFKEVTGVNFVTYVARIRFENARGLLHDPAMRVSEVAFAAGFQSLSQFNRVFKKFSGKSPTEYRAEYIKLRDVDTNREDQAKQPPEESPKKCVVRNSASGYYSRA